MPLTQAYREALDLIRKNSLKEGGVTLVPWNSAGKNVKMSEIPHVFEFLSKSNQNPHVQHVTPAPHHSVGIFNHAVQQAVEMAVTEFIVMVDTEKINQKDGNIKPKVKFPLAENEAWLETGAFVFIRTLPVRFAAYECPVASIPENLANHGWVVSSKLLESQKESRKKLAVLTLFGDAGRVDPWFLYLQRSDIPKSARIIAVNNSDDPNAGKLIGSATSMLCRQFASVEVRNAGAPYKRQSKDEPYIHPGKHIHVANLYNRIVPELCKETDYILFLEHDVIPPTDGCRALISLLESQLKNGAALAAGVYEQPEEPMLACAAKGSERWTEPVRMDSLPDKPFEIGMTGGGFTLYLSSALKHCFPLLPTFMSDPYLLGWDGTLGRKLHKMGFKSWLHPRVRCAHEYQRIPSK